MRRPFALPFVPTYLLVLLVIAFAVASGWLGLARLDAIEQFDEASARSAVTAQGLQALQNAVVDIETSARGYVISGDPADLQIYERARRDVPKLLASLRDNMRDDPEELALVERLVPLAAARAEISAAGIEQRREAPDRLPPIGQGRPGKDATDAIRGVIAELESRENSQIARDRRELLAGLDAARRDRYLLAGVIVLVAFLLFFAVRRLQSLVPPAMKIDPKDVIKLREDSASMDGRVAALLQDALLRTRLAAATTPAESPEAGRLQSLVGAMEHARDEHLRIEADLDQIRPEGESVVAALGRLAQSYSNLGGSIVKATMEKADAIASRDKVFLICRSAEWALEAMALRKRTGEIALNFTCEGGNASLRIVALPDNPDLPLRLSPREADEANMLQQAAAQHGGSFIVSRGPTGFALLLMLPADR